MKKKNEEGVEAKQVSIYRQVAIYIALPLLGVFVVLLTVNAWGMQQWFGLRSNDTQQQNEQHEQIAKALPKKLPRQLDGVLVAPEKIKQFPYCVMIENAAFDGVRPQSGLSRAPIVYEVIVEGGITRFMAIFGNDRPEVIGPVRSARDTFVDIATEYNCPYYHAGGSDTALARMVDLHFRSVNGLIEYQYFVRNPLKYAPHDFFTSGDDLHQAAKDHHWWYESWPDVIQWTYMQKDELEEYAHNTTAKKAENVRIGFDPGYEAEWKYDTKNKRYSRSIAGEEHIDELNGQVITADTIVIQYVGEGTPLPDKGRINWPIIGRGPVEIIHHGKSVRGIWKKPDEFGRTLFVKKNGDPLPLASGHTWVEVVPPHISVEYH